MSWSCMCLHKRLWKLMLVIEIVFMFFWPWSKDHLLFVEYNSIKNRLELMAKRPSGHILHLPFVLLEPFWGTTLIFSKFGPKMALRFLHFPTSLQVKRLAPKGKKMRMNHPFILGFCQNHTFDTVFTIIYSFPRKSNFFKWVSYLIVLCISDSNMGDPRLLLFQNRTLI